MQDKMIHKRNLILLHDFIDREAISLVN